MANEVPNETQVSIAPPKRDAITLPQAGGFAPSVAAHSIATITPGAQVADDTSTQQLLQGLNLGKAALSETTEKLLKEQREEEFKKGQMARQQNALDWSKAVESGVVPQTASPWFMKGFQNQEGRVAGLDYYTAMRQAYDQSPAKGSDDPKAYQEFTAKFNKDWTAKIGTDKSTDWWDGYKVTSDHAQTEMASLHAQQTEQAILDKSKANTGAEINVILNSTKDPKAAADQISQLAAKMKLEGMPEAVFKQVAAEAVIAKAKLGDPSMISVLDHVKTGGPNSPATLASDPKVAMARADASQWLVEKQRGDTRWAWANEDHQWSVQQRKWASEAHDHEKMVWDRQSAEWGRTEKTRSLMTQIQTNAMADPGNAYANSKEQLAKLSEVNPEAAQSVANFIDAFTQKRERIGDAEERPVQAQLQADMINAAGNPERQQQLMIQINQQFVAHKLNKETAMKMLDDAQRMASWDPSTQRKMQSPEMMAVRAAAKGFLTAEGKLSVSGHAALDELYANQAIDRVAMDLLKATDGKATPDQLAAEATKKLQAILPTIAPNNLGSGAINDLAKKTGDAVGLRTMGPSNVPTTPAQYARQMHPEDRADFLRLADEARHKGMAEFFKFTQDFDAKVGQPGLSRLLVEESAAAPVAPRR